MTDELTSIGKMTKEMTENKVHLLDKHEVVEMLNVSLTDGLSSDIANERLKTYGYNEIVSKKEVTLFEIFLNQFKDFLVIILIIASVISILIGEVTDSVVIILIVILNAILGAAQESRANKAMEALKRMAAPEAKVIRDGHIIEIPARELVPGDVVLLEAGNYVPADLRLVECINLKIDEASLTGESVPVDKNADIVLKDEVSLGDRINCAFMGTVVTHGRGKGIAVNTGKNTEIGKIAEMIQTTSEEATPLQRKLADTGKILGIASLVICGVIFVIGLIRGIPVLEMFMTAVSLAVAAIPEGLPAVITIVLAIGMQRMVKRHVIVKKLHAVETLGSVTVICSDKTGTLTQNEMTVTKIYTNRKFYDVSGEGYNPEGKFYLDGVEVNPIEDVNLRQLLTIGLLCNDAKLEETVANEEKKWRIIGDPTEGAIVVAAAKGGMYSKDLEKVMPRLQEIPFDSERKRMTTFHPAEKGYVAFIKGAPDIIINLSSRIYKEGEIVPITEKNKQEALNANHEMASQALRVLAIAYKELESIPKTPEPENIEKDLIFVGLIGMIDPPRPEVKEAIKVCKRAGIKPVMITGDYKDTAVAIAKELSMIENENQVLTGLELDKLDEKELSENVKDVSVYARVSPMHKLKIVDAIKRNMQIVAMTGDGVNDAPALKKADIGVAMGITGTDVAKEAADMILTDDNFASIVAAVEEGRIIYSNIRKFIFYLLSCNIAEILIIFLAMLMGLPVPLKPIQLLWVNLLTDAFPALALGMEGKEPDIMQKPPRKPDEPIIDKSMQIQIAVQGTALTVAVLGTFIYGLHYTSEIQAARTYAFATMIFGELLRAYTARSERFSVFKIGFFKNKYMVASTMLSLLLLIGVIYLPFLRTVFNTVTLSYFDWLIIVAFSLIPFTVAELSKLLLRK